MRWMKHLALASEDEKISVLIEQYGPEGYGMYWLLLETVAASMQPKSEACELTYSELRWSQKLRSSVRKTRSVVRSMHDLRLISAQSTGNRLRIVVPNLLKYRDEYSEKSRHVTDKVPPRTDTDTEQNIYSEAFQKEELAKQRLKDLGWVGIRKTPETAVALILDLTEEDFPRSDDLESAFMIYCRLNWFENFWGLYWRHDDKRSARTAYFAAVKNMEMMDIVDAAVCAQSAAMLARAKTYQPLAATWLNKERWGDELEISQEAGG
jgi:Domain of unknown function (DUF4373)